MASNKPHNPSEFICEVTRAQPMIAAYVRSLLPSHPDYMDIVQEVNITLWKKRKEFQPGTNFKAWSFKIARYHALNARRKLKTEGQRLIFDPDLLDKIAESAGNQPYQIEEQLTALQTCLKELRQKDRELLHMRYASQTSIETFARQNRRNPGTVRATLRRLRGILLKCVQKKMKRNIPPNQS